LQIEFVAIKFIFWYNKSMEQKKSEIKLKCASCGASLSMEDKKCAYCGTINPNYKQKEVKEIKPLKQKLNQTGMFGELFGNIFEDILNNFDEE